MWNNLYYVLFFLILFHNTFYSNTFLVYIYALESFSTNSGAIFFYNKSIVQQSFLRCCVVLKVHRNIFLGYYIVWNDIRMSLYLFSWNFLLLGQLMVMQFVFWQEESL